MVAIVVPPLLVVELRLYGGTTSPFTGTYATSVTARHAARQRHGAHGRPASKLEL